MWLIEPKSTLRRTGTVCTEFACLSRLFDEINVVLTSLLSFSLRFYFSLIGAAVRTQDSETAAFASRKNPMTLPPGSMILSFLQRTLPEMKGATYAG